MAIYPAAARHYGCLEPAVQQGSNAMKVKFAFDSLSVRDGRIFGWGWFLSPHAATSRLELRIENPDGQCTRLRCSTAGTRPDLAEAFPHLPHAINGGFLIQGRLPAGADCTQATLHVWLADGSEEDVQIEGFPGRFDIDGGWQGRRAITLQLLRSGQFLVLAKRLLAMLARRLSALRRAWLGRRRRHSRQDVHIIMFDHAMGGGANHFREEKIAEMIAQGHDVLLVSPHLPTLSYEIAQRSRDGERISRYPSLQQCLDALAGCGWVVVNDLASYDDPLLVLAWIAKRKAKGARTRFYLHDYFPACPVWTLVGRHGRYCEIPDFTECARCLPDNPTPFLGLLPKLDVPDWRRHWGVFLGDTDEIVAFSKASVVVLGRAFPELDLDRIVIRPHSLAHLPARRVQPSLDGDTVIAVVGAINAHKGADIVAEMARIIERERLPARIVVIGSIDNVLPSPALRVIGPYRPESLPDLLQAELVSVCLLPSVCHETFSYVTSELMHYGMPVAVFDLGAPAERIRTYELGCIIPRIEARAALDALLGFHRKLVAAATPSSAPLLSELE